MKKWVFVLFFSTFYLFLSAQDLNYVRYVVDTLCSPSMHGRGYVNNGAKIAAKFIKEEFERSDVLPFSNGYWQPFRIPINTFPKKLFVKVDDNILIPGTEYLVSCSSPGIKGKYGLYYLPENFQSPDLSHEDLANLFIVTDIKYAKLFSENPPESKGIIYLNDDNLWWHVSDGKRIGDLVGLKVIKERFPDSAEHITLDIRNKYFKNYKTQNVIGYVRGKIYPEKYFVFTAHYDHLGRMGIDTYFPGAHDNASGTAMILDLARHYSLPENQPDHSVVFMAFSAEEVGLLGSGFYNTSPLFPLKDILFLINLDLVSTGIDGIMVVNGKVIEEEYNLMVKLNDEYDLLKEVKSRGTARNSDHYWFYENGVPSFFIYTLGAYPYYHRTDDLPENLPFTEYDDLFILLTKFVSTLDN